MIRALLNILKGQTNLLTHQQTSPHRTASAAFHSFQGAGIRAQVPPALFNSQNHHGKGTGNPPQNHFPAEAPAWTQHETELPGSNPSSITPCPWANQAAFSALVSTSFPVITPFIACSCSPHGLSCQHRAHSQGGKLCRPLSPFACTSANSSANPMQSSATNTCFKKPAPRELWHGFSTSWFEHCPEAKVHPEFP